MKTVELYRRVVSEAAPAKEVAGKDDAKSTADAQINQTLELVTKYEMCNTKCLDMTKIGIKSQQSVFQPKDDYKDFEDIDEKKKDILVLHLPRLKVSSNYLTDNRALLVRPA